jgi:mitochondrial fission protein ELM1
LSINGQDRHSERPLSGRKGWLITDDKIGMQVQATGVAEALGLDWRAIEVRPRTLWRVTAPWGPPDPRDGLGIAGGPLGPPWPDVAIATGRQSIPYIRALRRRAGRQVFTVVLQDPKTGPKTADLIWVPEHDTRRGANVITTLTAPHGYSPERLRNLQSEKPEWLDALPAPRVAVVLGGRNAVYRFTPDDDARLCRALRSLAGLGVSFMITASRRTHPGLVAAVDEATAASPRYFWRGEGANPYPHFLAHADRFVVTGDSVNMTGEPLATGKPVWVFEPSGGSAKFARFHSSLRRYGATRTLPDTVTTLDGWTYDPLDSAAQIAREIERRWGRRQEWLGGPAAGTSGLETAVRT